MDVSVKPKLPDRTRKFSELLEKKVSSSAIGHILGVHRLTVSSFVKNQKLRR